MIERSEYLMKMLYNGTGECYIKWKLKQLSSKV